MEVGLSPRLIFLFENYMKVILLEDVKTLGNEGDIVEVSSGHAQNFLYPQNLAVPATPDAIRKRTEKVEAASKKENKEMAQVGELAKRLDGYELMMEEKTSDGGTLYGAVTAKMIASGLKKAGFKVTEEMVKLSEPIKELGEKSLVVDLGLGFEAEVKVVIESK